MHPLLRYLALLLTCLLPAAALRAQPAASQLHAAPRQGQVFLTWAESDTPPGTTFNVYVAAAPIRDVAAATRIGHHIEAHSATDWWENPAAFARDAKPAAAPGFRLVAHSDRLAPGGGLFVHTPSAAAEARFFAVTTTGPDGTEDRSVRLGRNATAAGVAVSHRAIEPIWQPDAPAPAPGAGEGLPLRMELHAKGGVVAGSEYLMFGDASMGWREGLPFRFSVRIAEDEVVVRPTDRNWINRPFTEAGDSGVPAIWTFWYGTSSQIYDRSTTAQGVPTAYTERRLLWLLDWVQRHYRTDRNRWYCNGSSMGGCGTLTFAYRHPELFAACHANVPIVAYRYASSAAAGFTAHRLEPLVGGPIASDLLTDDGARLLERMDTGRYVTGASADLPFLFILNGRQDTSIPWANNPGFYRTLDESRQGFAAHWNDGTHGTVARDAPDDIKGWKKRLRRFRLNESFPAFSHTSTNRDPGDGAPTSGDIVGWMNRGLDWSGIVDEPDHYEITLQAEPSVSAEPVRTDVTLRRVQHFRPRPGDELTVIQDSAAPTRIRVDPTGHITVPGVVIPPARPTRLRISR
ncbi:alpha/beta hydrolase-fold protein [Opitutus sp. ER46]|uniref:alpha/beta hydrolase-fold protein n=1 Tax=Opitutus sp. ER46 TaxID=2161864 RepID=UPI00130500A5|nr:alpha/beta hydrolase-fold protein [Opitutus sp. ER46]